MKGEIVSIRQILNDDLTVNCYEIVIEVNKKPNLKLGECEVIQIEQNI